MTDSTCNEKFKARLLQLREELLSMQSTRDGAASTVTLDQSSVGRLSRMDALQQQAMAIHLQQRVEISLRRIEAALRRCEDGTYGECLECGEAIGAGRLELDPASTLCIRCAAGRNGGVTHRST